MAGIPDSFRRYNDAWNEPDVSLIRGHLDGSVSAEVTFTDPANVTVGIDALEAMIADARRSLPLATYRLTSGIDGHNGRYRYLWEARNGDELLLPGMDMTRVDDNGLITEINGFFGDFPAL